MALTAKDNRRTTEVIPQIYAFLFSVTVTEVLWLLTEAYREEEKHSCRRPKRQRTGVVEATGSLSIVQVAKQCAEEKQCHGKETGVIHGAIVPVEAVTLKVHCLNTQKAENEET